MPGNTSGNSSGERKSLKEIEEIILDVVISGGSALVAKTVIAPIERMKLMHQTQASNVSIRTQQHRQMTGIFQTIKDIVQHQGFFALWRGHSATLLKYIPLQVLTFTFHSKLKRLFPKYDPQKHPLKMFLSNLAKGAIAGVLAITIVYPLDTVRTKMAADLGRTAASREFTGFRDSVAKIYRQGGFTSFYTAYPYSLLGTSLYRGFYFGLYETAMKFYGQGDNKVYYSMLCAQVSTNVAGLLIYPIDTVRRNLVLQAAKTEKDQQVVNDKTFSACARRLYSERGIRGLYAGCLINIIRGSGSSILLFMYDTIKSAIKPEH